MATARSKNTKPELKVRSRLHELGFRFRLHVKDLPGTPDIVLPRFRTVVLVHGCFWHRHQGCKYSYFPKTNTDVWRKKFEKNEVRDAVVLAELETKGWEVEIVWECETRRIEDLDRSLASLIGASEGTK